MLKRRRFLGGAAACACALCAAKTVLAKPLDTTLSPLIGSDYRPLDADERGLWHSCEDLEQDLAESGLVLDAPDLVEYTRMVLERLLDRRAADFRVYILRDPTFNASMAPNGLMIVHTGLLARVQDEAQYATVLGHEAGHYFRKHSIEKWRSVRTKSAIGAFAAAGAHTAAGYSASQGYNGQSWIDLANSINQALVLSLFSFSREQESDADAFGISLLAGAGYTTDAAAAVWAQLISERKASAAERRTRYRDNSLSAFSTHPPTEARMRDLKDTAAELAQEGGSRDAKSEEGDLRAALAPHMNALLAEQIKLNDSGASLYLLGLHARRGWSGLLRYYEGESYRLRGAPGDAPLAEAAFADATRLPDAPPEAWRGLGYALIKRGEREQGLASLSRYLELKPDAADAAMVRFSLSSTQ